MGSPTPHAAGRRQAGKRLGQHFLRSGTVVKKIIAALAPRGGETILEVGPGHGELTIPLAATCERGADRGGICRIVAVEKDAALADGLRELLAAKKIKNVEVCAGDILRMALSPTSGPYKIAGNIPYYLTGRLLRAIGEPAAPRRMPERAVFMLQREVAERICAMPPKMNRLAASVQFWAEPEVVCAVPRESFSPPPQVDSAVVLLKTRTARAMADDAQKNLPPATYYAAVRAIFAQPRKTILNNLLAGLGGQGATQPREPFRYGSGREEIAEKLRKLGVPPEARPQDLTVADIAAIARAFWG